MATIEELEHEVSRLTSELVLAERVLDDANQSITELETEVYVWRNSILGKSQERITELEAVLLRIKKAPNYITLSEIQDWVRALYKEEDDD